jgi:hypothetical protein
MRVYLLAGICCLLTFFAKGQQIIVNSNGDKIVMYPDGSWRPMEARDSILLKQNIQKSEPILDQNMGATAETNRNKAEEQNFLIRQAQELKTIILEEDKKVQNQFRDATNAQFKAGEMLHNAEANKALIEPDRLLSLSQEYDNSVKELKEAKLKQKSIKKLSGEAIDLTNDPEKIRKNKVDQLKSKYNLFLTNYEHEALPFAPNAKPYHPATVKTPPVKNENAAPAVVAGSSSALAASATKVSSSPIPPADRARNYVAAPYECKISIDTIDQQSHRRQIQVAPSLIFTHTDPELRPYFKDKELITCRGSLVKIGSYIYLSVEFQIASSHSQNNFGALEKESLLRFKLFDGDFISLNNIKSDRGHLDPYTGNTVFTGQYALGKEDIRKLNSSALDKIRILWSTGFEDYDVYWIDFFKDQLKCLHEVE